MRIRLAGAGAVLAGSSFAPSVLAAGDAALAEARSLGLVWGMPFAGILLSIALYPLVARHFWERHFGKIAAFWSLAFLVPYAITFGPGRALDVTLHTALGEYLPFMILLLSLFATAGGILIVGNLIGTPATNTGLLAIGSISASLLGTTGASMVLIRPMIRANADRQHNAHVFIFFIFLVSNIGGALTPVGDPPLFLGFLKGIDFFWTTTRMLLPTMFLMTILLATFYVLDRFMWSREPEPPMRSAVPRRVRVEGLQNVVYLATIVGAVIGSGLWRDAPVYTILGVPVALNGLARDIALIVITYVSWKTTPSRIRVENAFAWTPMQEVAILFAGIFITIIPVLAILGAGREGALAPVLALVSTPDHKPVNAAYFWLAGALSSFLDNAPTYLVFFNLAGANPQELMGPLAATLVAISGGAVYMGANTYIGNAPNFMVKAICEERGIRMPSFFGYMAWSGSILLPLFAFLSWLFFR